MLALEFLAQSAGADGVRSFLRDHRREAPAVFDQLSELSPLPRAAHSGASEQSAAWGVCLELWPLRAQRELWSAVASASASIVPSTQALGLANAFLSSAARREPRGQPDAVCIALAKAVVAAYAGDERLRLRPWTPSEEPSAAVDIDADGGEAAWAEVHRLGFHRAVFSQEEELSDGEDRDLSELDGDGVETPTEWLNQGEELSQARAIAAVEADDSAPATKKQRLEDPASSSFGGGVKATTTDAESAVESPSLPKEMETRAVALSKQLAQLARADPQPTREAIDETVKKAATLLLEIVNDVHATHTASELNFRTLCALLQLDSTSDEALLHIATALVESSFSSRYAALFIDASVLPKIQRAASVISRLLLQTTLLFGSRYGPILVDSLLLPLLASNASKPIGPPQAEAITRILRSGNAVPSTSVDDFVRRALEAANPATRSGLPSQLTPSASAVTTGPHAHLLSNESALLVFQNVFSARPALTGTAVEHFVAACEYALDGPGGEKLPASLKFATAIFTLISKYPEQCTPHVEPLEAIAKRLTSLMAKTTMRFLQKLKK